MFLPVALTRCDSSLTICIDMGSEKIVFIYVYTLSSIKTYIRKFKEKKWTWADHIMRRKDG